MYAYACMHVSLEPKTCGSVFFVVSIDSAPIFCVSFSLGDVAPSYPGIRGVMDVEDCDSLLAAVPPEACEPPAQAAERQHLQQQRDNLVLRLAEALDLVEGQPP